MSKCEAILIGSLFVSVIASAQATVTGPDYRLLNAIASCRSVACITAKRSQVHENIERVVLYTKWLMLDANSRKASERLFENLPTSDAELVALMTLPDWHDGATKSEADMKLLDTIYENWPRLLSVSVQRFPQYLPAYIRYGLLAVNDIHSDYTGFERRVCRADPRGFVAAFRTLSADDQQYIREHVFNPYSSKPIFLSEADS